MVPVSVSVSVRTSPDTQAFQLLSQAGVESDPRAVRKFARDVIDNQWVFFSSILIDQFIQTMKTMGYLTTRIYSPQLINNIRPLKELAGFRESIRREIATSVYQGLNASLLVGLEGVSAAGLNKYLMDLSSEQNISVEKLYELHSFLTAVNSSADDKAFFIEMIQLALPTLARAVWRYQAFRRVEYHVAPIGLDHLAGYLTFRYSLWRGKSKLIQEVAHQIRSGQMGAGHKDFPSPGGEALRLPQFLSVVQVPVSLNDMAVAELKSLGSQFLGVELKFGETTSDIRAAVQLEENYLEYTRNSVRDNGGRGTKWAYEVGSKVLEKRNEIARVFQDLHQHSENLSAARALALRYQDFLRSQWEDQSHSLQIRDILKGRVEFLTSVIKVLDGFIQTTEGLNLKLDENIAALEQLLRDLGPKTTPD